MRVVAGRFRRRKLATLEGDATRPMLDRMRETLFNILQWEVRGKVFADLYAGSGAVGIEALSRGARAAVFVENNPLAVRVIEANLREVGAAADETRVRMRPVAEALPDIEADIWFVGPPYPAAEEYGKTLEALGARGAELVVAQHDRKVDLPARFGSLERVRTVKVGSNALSFYRPAADEAAVDGS